MVFQPGKSGNPHGKPKGTPRIEWVTQFKKAVTPRKFGNAIKKLFDAIDKGESWAIKLLLDKTLADKLELDGDIRETVTSEDFRAWLWQGDLTAAPAAFRLPDAGSPAISGEPMLAAPDGPDVE